MATSRKLIPALLAAVALSGCSEEPRQNDVADLKKQVAQLTADNHRLAASLAAATRNLEVQEGERREEIRYAEQQAGVAAACDFLLPVCPGPVAKTGREAQQAGYSGGSSPAFWLALIAKLAALGAALGGATGVGALAWAKLARPAADAAKAAAATISEATSRAAAAEARVAAAQAEEQALRAKLAGLPGDIAKAQEELKIIRQSIAAAQKDLEAAESARKALDSF